MAVCVKENQPNSCFKLEQSGGWARRSHPGGQESHKGKVLHDQDDQDNGPVRRLAGGRGAARGGN